MRYPTMSGLKIDAAGVSNKDEEAKGMATFSQPADMPKPALKPPTQNVVEYGSKPPSLPSMSGEAKSVAFKEPTTYNEKLEQAFPATRNDKDPANRQMRETFFLMKDFGYDNFEKNSTVITKFKNQGKLDSLMEIQAELEQSYNGSGARASAAAASQPPPQVHVPPPMAQPQPQPAPVVARQDSMVVDQKKIAYSEKVNKKLKDPQKTIMLQLMELGYTDYDKNLKVVKKEKRPDIGTLLDKIVTAYNK